MPKYKKGGVRRRFKKPAKGKRHYGHQKASKRGHDDCQEPDKPSCETPSSSGGNVSSESSPALFLGFEKADIPINVLSLYDGISTGLVALDASGIKVHKYYSSEIDPDALAVQRKRFFGRISEVGCVRNCDERFLDSIAPIHLLIGGSPSDQLSPVNPAGQLFGEGSGGRLFLDYVQIMKYLKQKAIDNNHEFHFLFETTSQLDEGIQRTITESLKAEPQELDSVHFIPMKRKRLYWHNLRPTNIDLNSVKVEPLDSFLDPGRSALLPILPTVTTNEANQKQGQKFPVLDYDGQECVLTVTELEKLFGFQEGFTDNGRLSISERQKLLGKCWVVPVICHIFNSLRFF